MLHQEQEKMESIYLYMWEAPENVSDTGERCDGHVRQVDVGSGGWGRWGKYIDDNTLEILLKYFDNS